MAFEIVKKMVLPVQCQYNKNLRNFMCHHPRLRLRKAQVTSETRVKRYTKINVAKLLRLINFSPHRLFNYEEAGLTVVQHKVRTVISLQVKRRITLSSAEWGSLVTVVSHMNATLTYVLLFCCFLGAT